MAEKSKQFDVFPGKCKVDTPCLSMNQLIGYPKNTLNSQEIDKIENHVKHCALCADAVSGIKAVSDIDQFKQNIIDINTKIHQRFAKNRLQRIDVKVYYAAAAILLITLMSIFQLFFQTPAHEKLFDAYFKPYPNTIPLVRSNASAGDLEAAMMQYELGNFKNSLSLLKTIISKEAGNANVNFYTGICLLKTEHANEAIQHFNLVDEASNLEIPAYWYTALAHLKNNNIKTTKQILINLVKRGETYRDKSRELLQKINELP